MDDILVTIIKDWPILGVLSVVLIGLYRLAGRTIALADKHLARLISALESIADEIQRKERIVRDRDNRPGPSPDG